VKSIPLDEVDDAAVEEMFNENFFSFCRVTRAAAKRMKKQRSGIADCLSVSLRSFPWRTEFLN
jgi:NAD(P)-dependent dehydrogenase (short-subunit alcohol dehydrogenase family)